MPNSPTERRPLKLHPLESFVAGAVGPATSYNADDRTIPVVWLSQQDHVRTDFWGEKFILRLYAEGCNLTPANEGGAFQWSHPAMRNGVGGVEQKDVIGNIVAGSMALSAAFEGTGMVRLIEFPESEADCTLDDQRAAMKVARGYIRPISMDARLDEVTIEEFPDDPGALPIVHAKKWTVWGLSAVVFQQDPKAFAMEADMEPQVDTKGQPVNGEPVKSPQVVVPDEAALAAAESKGAARLLARIDEAREIAQVFGLSAEDEREIVRGTEAMDAVRRRLINAKAQASQSLGLNAHVRIERDERDNMRESVLSYFESRISHKAPTDAGRKFAHRRIEDVCRAYLVAAGQPEAETWDAGRAIDATFGFVSALTPPDMPVLLTEAGNRHLITLAREVGPLPFEALLKVIYAKDLENIKLVRRQFSGSLEEIPNDGKVTYPFQNTEAYEQGRAKQRGAGIRISRAALLADHLGGLDDLPQDALDAVRTGQMDRFWAVFQTGLLRDGKAICHADHANIVASGGGAPSVLAQMGKMRSLLAKAKDGDRRLRLRMTHVIVPDALRDAALQVTGQINPTETGKVVPSDYRQVQVLSDTTLDDSPKVWYAADAMFKCIAWIRLLGQEDPVINSETEFETRSLKIAVFHDDEFAPMAYQGIVRNVGE